MLLDCQLCKERGKKPWMGSDPRCAFHTKTFSSDNWSCATADAIREICEDGYSYDEFEIPADGVRSYACTDDQHWSAIDLTGILEKARTLWVSWYKSRGRTEAMWIMTEEGEPRLPTEEDCLKIIEAYKEAK